ncbi:hypothetical protein DZS_16680 [Dickeya ananatis]
MLTGVRQGITGVWPYHMQLHALRRQRAAKPVSLLTDSLRDRLGRFTHLYNE